MPNIAENNAFSNAQFRQSDLLKFIQEKGSKTLWRIVSGLDSITKKSEWPGGKEVRYHMTVDAGGGAFSGLNSQGGVFAHADRAYGIQGFMVPKYQTMTMYFDRILGKLTDSDQKAYLGHMKMEYEQKTMFQKSFMNLQQIMDGTGRVGTPVGLGLTNTSTGADFSLTNPSTLLKVKLSSADTATGAAAYFMEGMVVSFLYPSYDEGTSGTANKTKADCVPRYLVLGFKAATDSVRSYYDAFRVVRINQSSNEILLAPARKAAGDSDTYTPHTTVEASHMVQQGASATMWCSGTGGVTVTPWQGRTTALGAPAYNTVISNFNSVFSPLSLTGATNQITAAFLVLTGYIPTGSVDYGLGNSDFSSYSSTTFASTGTSNNQAVARAILGIGWDPNVDSGYSPTAIDLSLINPYLMTGAETLLFNDTNMVQGVPRYSIQQYLPSKKDLLAQPLTFNSLYSGAAEHYVRNRDKDPNSSDVIQWNLLSMNPLVYTSLLSLSEADRRITDDKGIRGTSCKVIQVGNKKFELDMNSSMRMDRIAGIPKDCLQMKGGTLEPVEVDGQREFMALNSSGRRSNAYESYFTVQGEQYCENLRDTLFFRNFTVSII